ncbi:MAG: hypothetical protein IPK60_06940 [Sandaracinaceae bacterium]|jgi:hypothetical protein|nr:hypothetical protein [Sandaracinaceae bacterium]
MDAPSSNRPPPSQPATNDPFAAQPTPTDDDGSFVTALQAAGLLTELDDNEFLRILGLLPDEMQGAARRMELLSLYFQGGDEPTVGWRRTQADRYFMHRETDTVSAQSILRRVCALAPEVGSVTLERIGEARYGQLVLRNNEHVIAVVDDDELDDDDATVPITMPTVTVRGIVRAMNMLLQRAGVRIRLIPLASNDFAEAYIAMSVRAVMDLAKAGILDEDDPEELMEFAGW